MKTIQSDPPAAESVWEYLVTDFLEMTCCLKEDEQDFLVAALKQEGIKADAIDTHPSFSIDGRVILIHGKNRGLETPGDPIKECWLYSPAEKKIRRRELEPRPYARNRSSSGSRRKTC